MARSWEDRVAEYVDSSMLVQRVKVGDAVCCRVIGNHGIYTTRADLNDSHEASCTCPYEGFPCKHIAAVEETFDRNPDSFVDADACLAELRGKPRDELLSLVQAMVALEPRVLTVLGVEGFNDLDDPDVAAELLGAW